MFNFSSRRLFCGLAVLALAIPYAAAGDGGYHYMYFDQARPLELDAARLAVRCDVSDPAVVAQRLAAEGIPVSQFEPVGVSGWSVAVVEGSPRAVEVESRVAALARSEAFEFVSPVFLDARGLPLLMTEYLHVGFEPDVPAAEAERLLAEEVGGVIEARDFAGLPGVYRVRTALKDGFDVLALANRLAEMPSVRFAESDMIMRAQLNLIPNDPEFPDQWGLDQPSDQDMDLPEAWDITTGDPSIVVVIIDCGIQQDHPDINQIPGQDFTGEGIPGGGPANDCDDHGTCVAGCVSAIINNGIGVVGVAPNCLSRSAKMGTIMDFFGFCLPFVDSQPSYVANALNWAVSTGARVTNSSFGTSESSTMTTAYNNAKANGVINFAATGNDGTGSISYPASLSSVVAVGALNSSGSLASFSQYGPGIAFCAPGEGIRTTDRTGGLGYGSGDTVTVDGTSFSSPNAAGVAALVLSVAPDLTPDEVEQVMSQTCVDLGNPGYDTTYGWGFVNAYNAVMAVMPSYPLGDLNCDGTVNAFDIDPFVLALSDPLGYQAAYPDCDMMLADVDQNGMVNAFDIDPFVSLLTGK